MIPEQFCILESYLIHPSSSQLPWISATAPWILLSCQIKGRLFKQPWYSIPQAHPLLRPSRLVLSQRLSKASTLFLSLETLCLLGHEIPSSLVYPLTTPPVKLERILLCNNYSLQKNPWKTCEENNLRAVVTFRAVKKMGCDFQLLPDPAF